MDLIQNFHDPAVDHNTNEHEIVEQNYNSLPAQTTKSENTNDCFNCNICFDSANDPIVTLCGHLYCWECMFKWLHVQRASDSVRNQACPVCKAVISQATLIPLYCHGSSGQSGVRKPKPNFIPPQPTASGLHILSSAENLHSNRSFISLPFQSRSLSFPHQQYLSIPYSNYATVSSSNLVSTTVAGIINPTIGLLGELVNTRIFGSTDTNFFSNPLPSSYPIIGHNHPRVRRHELQLDKSLNRVSIFLFCCFILCLLLF